MKWTLGYYALLPIVRSAYSRQPPPSLRRRASFIEEGHGPWTFGVGSVEPNDPEPCALDEIADRAV